jgi:hypothetical protein
MRPSGPNLADPAFAQGHGAVATGEEELIAESHPGIDLRSGAVDLEFQTTDGAIVAQDEQVLGPATVPLGGEHELRAALTEPVRARGIALTERPPAAVPDPTDGQRCAVGSRRPTAATPRPAITVTKHESSSSATHDTATDAASSSPGKATSSGADHPSSERSAR